MKNKKNIKNRYLGSTFETWLKEELQDKEFRRLYEEERAALRMEERLRSVAESRGLSIRKLAKRMRTSPSQVQRLFSENAVKCSLETLIRFSIATGHTLEEL